MATNLVEVSHDELAREIVEFYFDKEPLMVWGQPGCGKSETSLVASMAIAKIKGRNFVPWVSNRENQEKLFDDEGFREASFIYNDMRLSQKDSVEFSGIPDLDRSRGFAAWRPQLAYAVLGKKGAAGMLFYDEITKSSEAVRKAAYQTINDRGAGEIKFADEVSVLAAGNRVEDGCGDYALDPALANRFCHFELTPPDPEAWLKYAMSVDYQARAEELAAAYKRNEATREKVQHMGVDERIRAFMFHKPDLHTDKMEHVKKTKAPAWASPRSWFKASRLIAGRPSETEAEISSLYRKVGSAVGDGAASMFRAFLVTARKINIEELLANPARVVPGLNSELACSLIYSLPAFYKKKKKSLNDILGLINFVGDSGFTMDIMTETLHLIRRDNKADFDARINQCPNKSVLLKIAPMFKELAN